MTRAYSNFDVPPFHTLGADLFAGGPTLVEQSVRLEPLLPAVDAEPAVTGWRSVAPYTNEVVELYQAGYSLSAIGKKVGIAWDSVARLLDRAGLRERKNRSR